MTLPALFISHGAPTLLLDQGPASAFLAGLGGAFPRPSAVVVLSAHWLSARPTVGTAAAPETIHDFYGFPQALYRLRYPAPGAPALAAEVVALLAGAGLPAAEDAGRGLDHGAWVPLTLLYPDAGIPVVPVSIQPDRDARHHLRLGEALRPLRERGVLILGSGSITHNIRAYFDHRPGDGVAPWAGVFAEWVADRVAAGDTEALLDFAVQAPHAATNHPTIEHFLPLFAALGAGTPGTPGRRLYAGVENGVLSMDVYAFD